MSLVLGIDLGHSKTGIAFVDQSGNLKTQTLLLSGITERKLLANFVLQVYNLLKNLEIALVVLEQPLNTNYFNITKQTLMLHGALFTALGTKNIGAPMLTVHALTLKKFVTGYGRATKADVQRVIAAKTNHHLVNDEADAAGLAFIGHALRKLTLPKAETPLKTILNPEVEALIYNQFGLTVEKVTKFSKDRLKATNRKAYAKRKAQKEVDECLMT